MRLASPQILAPSRDLLPSDRLYLDTSIYNALADACSPPMIRALPLRLQALRLPPPLLSPLNIIEICMTRNRLRREKLVFLVQNLCHEQLLPEPEAFFVSFVVDELGKAGPGRPWLREVFDNPALSQAWNRVRADKRKTFVFQGLRRRLTLLKRSNEVFHAMMRAGGLSRGAGVNLKPAAGGWRGMAAAAKTSAAILKASGIRPQQQPRALFEAIWMMFAAVYCVGLTPFPGAIDRFWGKVGVSGTKARLEYAFSRLRRCGSEGPFVALGMWLDRSSASKYDQGNAIDGYHLTYLPYVHRFLTLDGGMLQLGREGASVEPIRNIHDGSDFVRQLVR